MTDKSRENSIAIVYYSICIDYTQNTHVNELTGEKSFHCGILTSTKLQVSYMYLSYYYFNFIIIQTKDRMLVILS